MFFHTNESLEPFHEPPVEIGDDGQAIAVIDEEGNSVALQTSRTAAVAEPPGVTSDGPQLLSPSRRAEVLVRC